MRPGARATTWRDRRSSIIVGREAHDAFALSCVAVADSTGGTLGPEETSGADQRAALPTASPPHALQARRGGVRNGNDIAIARP